MGKKKNLPPSKKKISAKKKIIKKSRPKKTKKNLNKKKNCGGKKKDNEANWMVSNSAKLDRKTKQHTQFGVSASKGSRGMAWTKSWRKKRKK